MGSALSFVMAGFMLIALSASVRFITKGTQAEGMTFCSWLVSIPMMIGYLIIAVSAPITAFSGY